MNVTDVKLITFEDRGKLKATGSITLDDAFVVTGIGVFEGPNGLFVSFPSVKGRDGEYHNSAYPLSKELREEITREVMSEYRRERDRDQVIERMELGGNEKGNDLPFPEGPRTPESRKGRTMKTSVQEKLKNAAEKVKAQTVKISEKVREESL